MKPGGSSLNPYAASYIPLSKRETNNNATTEKETEAGNAAVWSESSAPPMHNKDQSKGSFGVANHGIEHEIIDEELDMVLEYLQLNFPGLSSQSLIDVYWANDGDLEGTIDMLNQLEISLPDTLEIGDVPESASHKLKNVASEAAAASSSGSSESAVVSRIDSA